MPSKKKKKSGSSSTTARPPPPPQPLPAEKLGVPVMYVERDFTYLLVCSPTITFPELIPQAMEQSAERCNEKFSCSFPLSKDCMEIMPFPSSVEQCSNVKAYVEAGNYLLATIKKGKEGGLLWEKRVAEKLAARKWEEALDAVVERVGKVRVGEKTQGESSTTSCTRCEVLQQSVGDLELKDTARKQEITKLKQEMKKKITEVENELEPFKATSRKYHKILRRICLSEAKKKVTDRLKKAPASIETWESFMLGLTQEEVGILNLSPDAVKVLGTGAYYLNKAAHEASPVEVAVAIIDAPERKEVWKELFQFCYNESAWDVLEKNQQSDL